MSLIDAREAGLPTALEADLCIVGSGAAGITLARELAGSGLSVCLLESGGLAPDPQTESLNDLENTGYALRENYMSRARYFGGSCNLWAGRSMTFSPIDFESRDWVPRSGWPIPFDEVARYYPRAFRILDLPDPERLTPEILGAHQTKDERRLFADGRLVPTVSLWARSPRRFGSAYLGELRKAPDLEILLNASVTDIALDDSGTTVRAVTAATPAGARLEIRARRYVLACGGLENARLLLACRNHHAAGIANQHDQVGRCFMDHPRAVFGRVHIPAGVELRSLRGRALRDGKLQIGLGPSPDTQRRESLLNHFVTLEEVTSGFVEARYQSFIQTMKVMLRRGYAGSRWDFTRAHLAEIPNLIYLLSPKELLPHPLYRLLKALREAMPRRPGPRSFVVVYYCEQPPDAESRVTLAGSSDRYGMPKLSLHWRLGPEVEDSILRLQNLLAGEFEQGGVGRLDRAEAPAIYTDASHHMGTTRMSLHPRDGVVDADCRVHGVANLYIAGSSVFPSGGHANPTLTIVAMALRLADRLRSPRA